MYFIPPEDQEQPAPEKGQDKFVAAAYDYAERRLAAGMALTEIEGELIQAGFGEQISAAVANDPELAPPTRGGRRRGRGLTRYEAPRLPNSPVPGSEDPIAARRAAGRRNMLVGGLWCAGGLIVTLVSLAASAGGGTYIVAWGAILFGAIQFIRGSGQASGR
jgi:hypothetical protein